uniref:Uncharacterized protein n=1 Tax=Plectus sambesii TaxID=2011161 RepID=A0A914UW14_9BILA
MPLPGRLLRPPSLLLQWLLLRVLASARSSSSSIHRDYSGLSVSENYHCYSCMSKEFESNWRHLDQIYYRPRNFTDQCLNLPQEAYIGMMPCPHSVCISVVEPRILAGHHIGNNIIRGCYSGVFKHGATQQLLRVKNQGPGTSFCLRMPANRLLPPHLTRKGSNRTIQICACFGQLCNETPTAVAESSRIRPSTVAHMTLLAPLLASLAFASHR